MEIDEQSTSPKIVSNSWGRLEIEGEVQEFKDAKLFPGGARAWDWRETGTQHNPGVQPADLVELVEHGAEVVVLSTGRLGRLGVSEAAKRYLEELGVAYEIIRTPAAIQRYNELRLEKPTGALIHSTC